MIPVVGVSVGVGEGVPVGWGVEVFAGALNTTLGLLLFVSVTVNEFVVSCTVNVLVPAFSDVTVKLAWPFCVEIV